MTFVAAPGNYTVDEVVLETEFDGEKKKYTMMQVCYIIAMFFSFSIYMYSV